MENKKEAHDATPKWKDILPAMLHTYVESRNDTDHGRHGKLLIEFERMAEAADSFNHWLMMPKSDLDNGSKAELEYHLPGDGRSFLNYWNWRNGDDVIAEIIDGKLIQDGKEISLAEFLEMIKIRVTSQ